MISNRCPRSIDPELWAGMSADARYQAQVQARAAAQAVGFCQWLLLLPPVAFIALPPVQTLINRLLPPSHYVKLHGRTDLRKYLSKEPLAKGQRVAGHTVTSGMGDRIHPIDKTMQPHNGVDIATGIGTPLYAPAVGNDKVTVRCWQDALGGGTVAEISSQSIPEYRFKALHLSRCDDGSFSAGEPFAATGASGKADGPHLHWAQLPAHSDSYLLPTTGYAEWVLSGSTGADLIDIPALKASIIAQESNGNPTVINPDSGALGLGQVMPENIAGVGTGWDYEALGRDVSAAEYLADPQIQNKIIDHQLEQIALSQSTDATGTPRSPNEIAKRSAAVWYSGRSNYCQSTGAEYFGQTQYPSGAAYCDAVVQRYQSIQERRLEQLSD